MNFSSEKNKPIFLAAGKTISFSGSEKIFSEALANDQAAKTDQPGTYLIKAAAVRKLPKDMLLTVSNASQEQLLALVIARLEASPEAKFRFLDGRVYQGSEAAAQVAKKTAAGNYIFEVEKETLKIVQEAALSGEI